jgi:SAM-dependent methyltransferase
MAFEELKQRQSAVWGMGTYQNVTETIADIHDEVVKRLDPQPGERWLDIATGTGAVAERAATRGAHVTGIDLAPALIDTAKERARDQGLEIDYQVGDCEQLAFEDASFDIVSSTFGVMFAPDHRASANELARVTRPGGRLGLTTWRPDGAIGEMFRMLQRFQPPPPEGAGNPLDWGREEIVEQLLGDAFELEFQELTSPLTAESGEEAWQLFSTSFGPIKALSESLEGDRLAEFHDAFKEFHEGFRENGGVRVPRQYLLVLGTRR